MHLGAHTMTDAELAAIRARYDASMIRRVGWLSEALQSRNDIPALLAEIERLRAARTALPEYGTGTWTCPTKGVKMEYDGGIEAWIA